MTDLQKENTSKTNGPVEDADSQSCLADSSALKLEWLELCKKFLPLQPKGSIWGYCPPPKKPVPDQGWKIHISATILTASKTLRAVAPLLQSIDLAYKAPRTLDELRKINSGIWYGYSQVGKVITIYTRDVDDLKKLCKKLHLLTRNIGLGPQVPFDLKYALEANIYYRYGSFRDRIKDGRVFSFFSSPSGERFVDQRNVGASAPLWSPDPVRKTTQQNPKEGLPARYIIYRTVSQRGKGGVYEALDIASPPRQCIIKEGRLNGETHWDSRDGLARTRNEGDILRLLAKSECNVPTLYDHFELNGNVYLVLEKISGISLEKLLLRHRKILPFSIRIHICNQLCKLMAKIHKRGIVWRDCKPANLLLEPSGRLRPIDFEGATSTRIFESMTWSTPLFAPPEVATGFYHTKQTSNLPEDLFALGCCLFLFLEGHMPFIGRDFSRTLAFRTKVPVKIQQAIRQLITTEPNERPKASDVYKIIIDHKSAMA